MSSPLNNQRQAKLEKYFYVPFVQRTFEPRGASPLLSTDVKNPQTNKFYDVGTIWLDTTAGDFYILESIDDTARWVIIAGSGTNPTSLDADDGNTAAPSGGIISVFGNVVANATHAKAVFTRADIANTLDIDVQVANDIASTDVTKVGLAAFDSSQFTVDANGFVQLVGSGAGIQLINTDDGSQVIPDGGGEISSIGNVVANGTHAKAVYFHRDSVTTNELDLDVQISAAIAATDVTSVGLAAFNDAQFSVDANGFVSLTGGITPPTLGLTPDAFTGPGTDPVVPDGSGNIDVTGVQVATGTTAQGLRTNSTAANQLRLEIQRSTSNATTNADLNGISHFDNDYFTVDGNAFVSLTGISSFFWIEVTGTSDSMVVNRGYVANNAGLVTLTLPVTAAFGTVIRVAGKGAGLWRIAQNASQQIHVGSVSTTAGVGGRIDAADRRDCIELLCIVADTEWETLSSVGTLTIT